MAPAEPDPDTLVSIVLATGRDCEYLEEALASVRAQTYRSWELVVVDNGAEHPDAIAALVRDDPRMSVVSIDHSSTLGRARNEGIARTRGSLVALIDDDDVWHPDRLARHVEAHRHFPDAPASFSGYWHMRADGERFGPDWRSRQAPARDMLRGAVPTPLGATLVVRRDVYGAVGGFSPDLPILEDFEFALRVALSGDLVYIDELLYGYRRHSFNMTSTEPKNHQLRRMVMEEILERQHWAASARGQPEIAGLFTERLDRHRRDEARIAGHSVPRHVRHGDLRSAFRDTTWSLRRAPLAFVLGFASRFTGHRERGS